MRPVTVADLEAPSVLAARPSRRPRLSLDIWLARAKTGSIIQWETKVPDSWDEVILQGPHFAVATPFNKFPNDPCRHNQDYSGWDLENLPERIIPRTNYQRSCAARPDTNLGRWNGRVSTESWRYAWRRMASLGVSARCTDV